MKKYQFNDINNIFVIGDVHGELKTMLSELKSRLFVKPEDADTPHPMELERQARKKAKEEAMRNQPRPGGLRLQRGANPFDRYGILDATYTTATISSRMEEEIRRMNKMARMKSFSSGFSNSIMFVTGDCGFGIKSDKYYNDMFENLNKILNYNNMILLFVRVNYDDPSFFSDEKINLSNIKTIPDYSVVEAKGKNILCIGGAVSTDRSWKKEQEKRINSLSGVSKKKLYWEDETPVFDTNKLDEISAEYKKIDYVISHTAPSFATPSDCIAELEDWVKKDESIINDIKNERLTMDRIFEYLRDHNIKPTYWAYSHFDGDTIEKRSDVIFRAIYEGFNPMSIISDVNNFEQANELSRAKKKAKKKLVKSPAADWGRPVRIGEEMPMEVGGFEAPDGIDEDLDGREGEQELVADEAYDDGAMNGVAAGMPIPENEPANRNIQEIEAATARAAETVAVPGGVRAAENNEYAPVYGNGVFADNGIYTIRMDGNGAVANYRIVNE